MGLPSPGPDNLSIYIPRFKLTEPSRPWWYPVLRAQVGSCTSCSDSLSGPRVTQKFSVYHSPAVPPAQPDEGTLLLTQWPPTLHLCLIPPRNKTGKELTLDLLYDINNPYGFRDWDWGEFKLHPDLDLEERINQFEILKDHKEELRKRRKKFLK